MTRRMRMSAAWPLLAAGWLLLSGCAAERGRPGDAQSLDRQQARERQLSAITDWSLRGRMAVSGGGDGGSGQLHWQQADGRVEFEVRAPVSRQTWRLVIDAGGARIDGLEGGERRGPDAHALLLKTVGWDLPLASLDAWVRGMRASGPARLEFDADGLPTLLEQDGWRVEYRGWDRRQAPPLPSRVFASRDGHRVRLAIESWTQGR